jgi:hypothetical protein
MNVQQNLLAAIAAASLAAGAFAHDDHSAGHSHSLPVEANHRAAMRVESGVRIIEASGWPDHQPGRFPRRGNPNALATQDYTFRMPAAPKAAEEPTRGDGWFFGVALNGVPFEPGTAEAWNNDRRSGWRYEAKGGTQDLGLDEHNAHVQPNGAYHYHGLPTGLIERLGGDSKRMLLIGYAADGFPMYSAFGHSDPRDLTSPLRKMASSYRLKSGERPSGEAGPGGPYDGRFTEDFEYVAGHGDLDDCHGRFGVTPEHPEGIYHYYVTDEFPFVGRFWRGTPDASFRKARPAGRPGVGPDGPPRDGRPPRPRE